MKINEVDPRNYDSDIDYYNALNAKPKQRTVGEPRLSPAQQDAEDEDAISQQRQAAAAKARKERETTWDNKQEGSAPNGQQYNSVYTINAPSKASADGEAYSFKDYHWGAKKVVDQEYKDLGDGRVELKLYVVDNHKYGLWRPWKDSPVYKEGVAEGGPFSYGAKKPRRGSVADLAAKKRKEQDKNYKPTEPKDQMVGTAKVTKGVAESYTGRETKDGTWRVFKDGKAVAVAGPFKSREEVSAWIKKQKQGVAEGSSTRTCPECDGSGEDTLDQGQPCHRCKGKGHILQKPHPDYGKHEKKLISKMSNDEKVDKGWRNPNIDEGTEQVYKVIALDKGNALKKPTKMKVKADSIEDLFSRLSANDWYPLEINGVEVIAGKRLKQGVAEGTESSIEKKIQAKQDSLSLAREQRRARGQRQQGPREIKLQAEIDKLNTELTQLKKKGVAEGVDIVGQDSDLDQQVFTLNVDGKTVSFTYWDYENNFQSPDIKDIYQQAREQLGKKLSPEQIKAVARSVFKSFKSGVAEGLPQTLRKVVPGYAKREIDKKMDAGKFGKTDADKDANYWRYKKIQDKLKEQGVAEGSDNIRSMIQQYEDMVELVYDLPPGRKKNIAIDKRDALEAQIEAMPGGSEALRKWARAYNDSFDEGVAEGGFKNLYAEFSGYGNYMQGRAVNVFKKAGLEIVSKDYSEDEDIQTYIVKGDRWSIEKAGEFLERNPEQYGGYHFVKQEVVEAIPYALSAANANAEYERTRTHLGGYKGRVDTEVGSKDEYFAVMKALQRAAKQAGQHVECGLSDNKMSIFSDSMNSDELDEFVDDVLEQGINEGFKNSYSVGDRVDSPIGTGTIVALSKNIDIDDKVKVKLDDPSKAGEDGKYKDTFVLTTAMLKHLPEESAKAKNPYAIGMAQAMKSTGDKPPLEKATIRKAHEIAKRVMKQD